MDAPDPTDPDHQHLFGPNDVARAWVEVERVRVGGGSPVPSSCVLCGQLFDLTETLRASPAARRRRRDQRQVTEVAPPVEPQPTSSSAWPPARSESPRPVPPGAALILGPDTPKPPHG